MPLAGGHEALLPPLSPGNGTIIHARKQGCFCNGPAMVASVPGMFLGGVMRFGVVAAVCVAAFGLAGCAKSASKQPLNPPQLVGDQETEMAVQLFMQATITLARYYGYDTLAYDDVRDRSQKAGFSVLPFMPPETIPATPGFRKTTLKSWVPREDGNTKEQSVKSYQKWIDNNYGYTSLVKYYIATGHRAAQIICRNYLSGLEERNRYIQFLQDQYGVFNNVAGLVLGATNANGALRDAFTFAKIGVDGALDKYQEYRFLNVDYEEARILVETAQDQLADYYYRKADGVTPAPANGRTVYARLMTFSDALNAVSVIEAQCTRAGIRRLISKAVYATPTNMTVDPFTGAIVYISNVDAGNAALNGNPPKGDGSNVTGTKGNSPKIPVTAAPPAPAPEALTNTGE